MGRCVIPTCRNNSHKTRTTEKTTKYHVFPKDVDKRSEWIKKLRSENWIPDSNTYVCSEHFLPSDFERDLKAELLKLPPKRILKPEAVPSVNLSHTSGIPSQERKKLKIANGENKENAKYTPKVKSNSGYIISYLGKPRLIISNTCTKGIEEDSSLSNYHSQSRIISLSEQQNVDEPLIAPSGSSVLCGSNTNLSEEKNIFNLDDLCRLCGSYSNRMISIFGETKYNYPKLIRNHFPEIEVCKEDILPTQICFKCESTVVAWYQFHKTCNTVNKRFQSILTKLVSEPDIRDMLARKRKMGTASEDPITSEPEKMDEDMSCPSLNDGDDMDDDIDDEIEIVEVKPDFCELFEEIPDTQGSEADQGSESGNETLNDDTEMNPDENEAESKLENSLGENEPPNDDRIQSTTEQRLKNRRLRRRQMSNALRMCHMCGKVFTYPESLRRHLKTVHSDERPFKCHLCTSSFNRNHNLTIHIKVVHQHQRIYPKKKVPRLCDYCGKVLLSSRSLEEHISCMHTERALYECDVCHATFHRKLSFEKHRASNQCEVRASKSNATTKSVEVFLKYCEICGLEFKKEHFYLKHTQKHMTSLTCPVCSVLLDDASVLKEHLNTEHPEVTPFECDTCGKKFKTKTLLNCHATTHSAEKRYKCEYCSTKFLKKKYLTTHILTHTGERPFVCTICGRGFKQSGDMRKHKATHIRKQL